MIARQQNRTAQADQDQNALDSAIQATQQQQQLTPELLAMKMENESILAECRVRPRNFDQIKKDLTDNLDAFPELSDNSIYEKPVGSDEGGKEKYARGLSIRAAETLAEAYGFNRVRVDVTELGEDKVKVEATFTDFQRGRIWQDAGIVSKYYKARGGAMRKHADDRFYGLVVKAEASRRVREVILRCVNGGLKAWFEAECERRLGTLLDEDKLKTIVDQFATRNVTKEQLEKFIGRPQSMGWTVDDRKRLAGVWTAIRDGEAKIDDYFGASEPESTPPGANANGTAPKGNGAKPSDFSNAKLAANQSDPKRGATTEPAKPQGGQQTTGPVSEGKTGQTQSELLPPESEVEDAFQQFRVEVESSLPESARSIYDKWFGPDCTIEFLPEHDQAAAAIVREREAEATRETKPQQDGAPADGPSPALTAYLGRIEKASTRQGITAIAKQAKDDPALTEADAKIVAAAWDAKLAQLQQAKQAQG